MAANANYSNEGNLRGIAMFTPEEMERADAFERSPGNIAELQREIARTRDPGILAILQQELAKLTRGGPVATIPGNQSQSRALAQPQSNGYSGSNVSSAPPSGASSGTSSRTSRSYSSYDPQAMAAALNSGIQLVSTGGSVDVALGQIKDAVAQRQQAEASTVDAIVNLASLTGAQTAAETAVGVAAATRRSNILKAGNIHADDIDNRVDQASNIINQTDLELEPLGQEIDARMSVGMFDNPFQWLVNQTRLPGLVGQYNSLARKQNRAIESAKNLQSLAATQQSLNSAIEADELAAAGKAKAATDAARAQEALSRIQIDAAGSAIRDAMNSLQIEGTKFNTNLQIAKLTKESIMESEGVSAREAEKRAAQLQVDNVNRYLRMIGSNLQYTPEQFKAIPPGRRDVLIAATGSGNIANKFADAAQMIDTFGSIDGIANTGDAAAANWFKGTVAAAQAKTAEELKLARQSAGATGKVIKEEEFLMNNLNKMQELYVAETANMAAASEHNPLKIAYPAIAKSPKLDGNPVAEYIRKFGPLSPEPVFTEITEKQLLDRFTASALSGTIPVPVAAAAISDFYKIATAEQAQRTKYGLFGLSKPATYTARITGPSLAGRLFRGESQVDGVVDMQNQSSVESYLTKNVARQLMIKQTEGIGLFNAAPSVPR